MLLRHHASSLASPIEPSSTRDDTVERMKEGRTPRVGQGGVLLSIQGPAESSAIQRLLINVRRHQTDGLGQSESSIKLGNVPSIPAAQPNRLLVTGVLTMVLCRLKRLTTTYHIY